MYPTPGRNVNGDDSIDAMPTPETPYGITWDPNPSKRMRKTLKRAIQSLPENEHDRRVKRQKAFDDVVKDINKKMTENIKRCLGPEYESDGGDNEEGGTEAPVFHNYVIYVPRKLEHMKRELKDKVTQLGGEYRHTYDSRVTHFIYQGKAKEFNRELRAAKEAGKIIVSPEWINDCFDSKKLLEESNYPYSYNPNMTLNIVSQKVSPSPINSRQVASRHATKTPLSNADIHSDDDEISVRKPNTFLNISTNNRRSIEEGATNGEFTLYLLFLVS